MKKTSERMHLFSPKDYGLSMIEVVIAMAMLGAVSLGFMQLQKSSVDMQVEANKNMELINAKSNLNSMFLNQNICNGTMGDIGDLSSGLPKELPMLKRNVINAAGQVTGTIPMFYTEEGATSSTDKVMGSPDKRLVLKSAEVIEYTPEPIIPGSRSRKASVKLEFKFAKRDCMNCTDDERIVSHFVNLESLVGTGVPFSPADPDGKTVYPAHEVVNCFSAEGNAIATAMRTLCESMDFDGESGMDYIWNEASQTCEVDLTNPPSYCQYGGSFMTGAPSGNFSNPRTGDNSCPSGYVAMTSGYYTEASVSSCGKKCVSSSFTEHPVKTCVKCVGGAVPTGGGGVINYTGQSGSTCTGTPSCSSGKYPIDQDGDGCEESCCAFDPITYSLTSCESSGASGGGTTSSSGSGTTSGGTYSSGGFTGGSSGGSRFSSGSTVRAL